MKLYNTLTRKKEDFIPITPGIVKMYACGPTVYNLFHIGNARMFIVFDVLRRYFEYRGFKVTFVQNFTDIDDKVINRANEEGVTFDVIADRYIKEYFQDAGGLGVRPATVHPKATDCMADIIDLVKTLVEKGFAYEANGDVYYRVSKFPEYGKLSHQPLDDLEAGARIDIGEHKENPMDFALWKAAKPGEPSWTSPWGDGRPGWHIECSAMANRYLGETIDIHGGGQDLIFPHHENEIAQSEAAHGCEFAHYWLHNGYLNVDSQKMSKSLGNFFMTREAAKVFGYEAIRMFMLSAHYRSPLNYLTDSLESAKASLERIYNAVHNLEFLKKTASVEALTETESAQFKRLDSYRERFIEAMDDDLNTADALGILFELIRDVNTFTAVQNNPSKAFAAAALSFINELCDVLGIAQSREQETVDIEIEELIEKRQAARKNRDFKAADAIRDELKAKGILLEDTAQGVKWKKA